MSPGIDSAPEKHVGDLTKESSFNDREKRIDGRSSDEESQSPLESPRSIHGILWLLVVLGIFSSMMLYALDGSIMANIIPVVATIFGNNDKLSWLSVGFMVGGLAVVLPVGKLYDLFNTKTLFISSITLFLAGSALCGAAPTINAFIVGRVIAGIGGNSIYFGALTLISVNTNDRERPTYLGLIGLLFGVGTVVGPVVGGAFAQSSATWRWGFYLNLCIGGLFAPVYLFLLPDHDPRGSQVFRSRLGEFDYVGALLSVASLTCLVIAINFGGTVYAWRSGAIIALFIVSGVCSVLFAFQQSLCFMTKESYRMFPVHFLKVKEYVLLFVIMVASNTLYTAVYYIPIYFQFTRGESPLSSAVRLLPIVCCISGTIMINGGLLSKYGYYLPWYLAGSTLSLIGGVLLSHVSVNTATAYIYGAEILLGVGIGSYAQAGHAVMQAIVEPTMLSYAITFLMQAQLLGLSLGLSIGGSIFVNQALNGLKNLLPAVPPDQLQAAIIGTSGSFFQSLPPSQAAACLEIIVGALRHVFILIYTVAALSLVLAPFLSKRKINLGLKDI